MNNKQIKATDLDFDLIKSNLKTFLRGQDKFLDYNFEGALLSNLLDVLAYNTHYNALYTNFAVNEMFLDSASKMSSVISHAKLMGYTAKSIRSSIATINLIITDVAESPTVMVLPKGTVFRTKVADKSFAFVTRTDYTTKKFADRWEFKNVELVEGKPVIQKYVYSTIKNEFVISNNNADISTLKVKVQDNSTSDIFEAFNFSETKLNVKGIDSVYFLKQREDQFYEVYFGDGAIGKQLTSGNVIHLDYLVSNGEAANGAENFVYASGFRGDVNYHVTLVTASFQGVERESIESIRFNAPRKFMSQNRAVTTDDYINLIKSDFANVESVTAWGGEDNIPKTYGKIYIAIKPIGREILNFSEKNQIEQFVLKSKNVVSVTPVIVDPRFLRIEVNASVYYNPALARRTAGNIATIVKQAIINYSNEFKAFNKTFRFSKLSSAIDNSENSIISNITKIALHYPLAVAYGVNYSYSAKLGNPVRKVKNGGTFYTTRFRVIDVIGNCYLVDNGLGNIQLRNIVDSTTTKFIRNVGTLNYETGEVTIKILNIFQLADTEFRFTFLPASNDVIPQRDLMITIPENLISVTMLQDDIETGVASANANHIFTMSNIE